ncbi:unnamed protein product (macronuclear) [Paramecium tetraurelia]|uniref:Uncharacterized protein n=1 Tax=Paramecium tetraurelia TaxID=5888 RepID=A0C489_PARTE|nr:uncharacterized protein GSPATT00035086001 [Paramecium tetraurelia]CAK65606.1 unnamed protein product [Paramecium tetraurelia]|eukprot:XP_001433003.1 hypothetical protein (macronuclear) [Paramecium tetraurelia strain d4-2]
MKSFNLTHDAVTRKYNIGQVHLDIEKQAKPRGKKYLRQVTLQENQMAQVNNKTIPYPTCFTVVTREQYEQLPNEERLAFPWIEQLNKPIRILYDRHQGGEQRTQLSQFQKATAIYFDTQNQAFRFIEFLKFRNAGVLEKSKKSMEKVFKRFQYQTLLRYTEAQNKKLELQSAKISNDLKSKQTTFLHNSNEIRTYDSQKYRDLFKFLTVQAKQKQQLEQESIRQGKLSHLRQNERFFQNLEKQNLKSILGQWKNISVQMMEERQEREKQEQEALRLLEQQQELLEQQKKEEENRRLIELLKLQHKDLHFSNFKLIVGDHIRLLNPILFVQFKPLESEQEGKIEFVKGTELSYMELDGRGWRANVEITLSHFKTQDILEFIIFDDYEDFNERILAKAQEEPTEDQAFIATARKVMQGRISILEFEKNLNSNRRHFARLDVSADLQQNLQQDQQFNQPMIQIDLHEDVRFKITNSTINPFYLDIVELPITANELKYYIRQLKDPRKSMQQQWEEFKVKSLEDALQSRGQIWANSKQSEDDLIEIQEFLSEEGYDNKDGRFKQLYYYLYHNRIQNSEGFVRDKLMVACKKGFTKQSRVELIPILLQFNEKIKNFADDHGLEWHENLNILDIVSNEIDKYMDVETQQINRERVEQYISSIKFKYNNVWTNIFMERLNQWKDQIYRIVNGCGVIDNTQDKLLLIVRLFQLFDGKENCDELIYKIIRCLRYQMLVPKLNNPKINMGWFKDHLSNLFSGFFYFDVWLRVFDYIIGIGFIEGSFDKVIASVVGGILNEINYSTFTTQEEFIVGLNVYGRLLCNPEKLIIASYNCYLLNQFEPLEKYDDLIKQMIQKVNPLDNIHVDQLKLLNTQQQSQIIDIPEEHEGSVYDIQESQIFLPKAGTKFVFKQRINAVYILIHSLHLHQIDYYGTNVVTIQGQQRRESEELYFELPYSSQILDISVNEKFRGRIDLRYLQVNTIYKNTLIFQDDYDLQRHYQISEMEYSILLQGDGCNSENIISKDQAISYFMDQCILFNVKHSAFSHPDAFKSGNSLNYVEFKQLVTQYFQLDPAQCNFQELYSQFLREDNASIYLVDVLFKLTHSKQKRKEILSLFIPNDLINHQQYRRQQMQYGDVRFVKVTLSDDSYEKSTDLTDYFNSILQSHFQKYNSYDLLLIDENNRFYLLDNISQISNQFTSQMLILQLKYNSYGNVRKVEFQMSKQFQLARELQTQASSIKELLENNQRLLCLDCKFEINENSIVDFHQHLVYIRCREGAKQLEKCTIVGQIKNKNNQLKYYVVQLDNNKKVVVYKEDVLLFDTIQLDELDVFEKTWKSI